MAVLLTVLLGACQKQAGVPEKLDGLYFTDSRSGYRTPEPQQLLLEQGFFELLENAELSQRGTFEARDGLLRLKPIGRGTGAELETTYAVVEGHLLLGVLRQVGGERNRWTSVALPIAFLGHERTRRTQPGGFRIDWDMGKGEWRFTSGARHVLLNGVTRLEHPVHGGRLFVPVFRSPAQRGGADDPETMLAEKNDSIRPRFYFGWENTPQAPLVWDGMSVRPWYKGNGAARPPSGTVQQILAGEAGDYTYERRGDVVVTPWTMDLGPVGLLPVRADPSKLAGSYVSGDQEFIVSDKPPAPGSPLYGYAYIFFQPGQDATCHYAPDVRGLVTWTLGMDHPPHAQVDVPRRVFCFALADGRVVRYVSSGGCGGAAPARLNVFERRVSPAP